MEWFNISNPRYICSIQKGTICPNSHGEQLFSLFELPWIGAKRRILVYQNPNHIVSLSLNSNKSCIPTKNPNSKKSPNHSPTPWISCSPLAMAAFTLFQRCAEGSASGWSSPRRRWAPRPLRPTTTPVWRRPIRSWASSRKVRPKVKGTTGRKQNTKKKARTWGT